jgi:hypothetical protein
MTLSSLRARAVRDKQADLVARVSRALLAQLVHYPISGTMIHDLTESWGFSRRSTDDAIASLTEQNLVRTRGDGALTLNAPSVPRSKVKPVPAAHPGPVAAVQEWERHEGHWSRDSRPADYWARAMSAVAPAFAAETQRELDDLRARVAELEGTAR